jgi:hypothetical protein
MHTHTGFVCVWGGGGRCTVPSQCTSIVYIVTHMRRGKLAINDQMYENCYLLGFFIFTFCDGTFCNCLRCVLFTFFDVDVLCSAHFVTLYVL